MIHVPLFLRRILFMATVPQELIDLLVEAQKQLDESNDAATFAEVKEKEAVEAAEFADEAKADAFVQLQEANAAAAVALEEIKKHFGL